MCEGLSKSDPNPPTKADTLTPAMADPKPKQHADSKTIEVLLVPNTQVGCQHCAVSCAHGFLRARCRSVSTDCVCVIRSLARAGVTEQGVWLTVAWWYCTWCRVRATVFKR